VRRHHGFVVPPVSLQDEIRRKKPGLPACDDRADNLLVHIGFLCRNKRSYGEDLQRIGDRQCALCRCLPAGERKGVRLALALTVDVDAAHLVHEEGLSDRAFSSSAVYE
jgi:hypothetical protein